MRDGTTASGQVKCQQQVSNHLGDCNPLMKPALFEQASDTSDENHAPKSQSRLDAHSLTRIERSPLQASLTPQQTLGRDYGAAPPQRACPLRPQPSQRPRCCPEALCPQQRCQSIPKAWQWKGYQLEPAERLEISYRRCCSAHPTTRPRWPPSAPYWASSSRPISTLCPLWKLKARRWCSPTSVPGKGGSLSGTVLLQCAAAGIYF